MDQLIFYMNSNFILGQYILIVGKFKYFYFPYLVWIRFYYFSASLLDLCITSVHVACDIYLRKLYTLFCGFPKTFLRWIQSHMGYGFNKVILCNLWILWMPLSRCVHNINFHCFVCNGTVEQTIETRSTDRRFWNVLVYCIVCIQCF